MLPLLEVYVAVVAISKVDAPAALLGNTCRQCHLHTRCFNTTGSIIATCTFDVRTMCKNTAGNIFEALPLLEKIVTHVIANLVDEFSMRIGNFSDMRRINNDFAPIGNGWLCFVHRFGGRPEVIIDGCRSRKNTLNRTLNIDNVQLRGEISGLAPGLNMRSNIEAMQVWSPENKCQAQHRQCNKICGTVDDTPY